jgi:predicted RNA-binding protein
MAKFTHKVALKGEFVFSDMEVIETSKEAINTYDLTEILKRFDGRTVSITISEDEEIEPKQGE